MFHLIKKTKRIVIVIIIIFVLFPLKKSYAQGFSWSGMIELSFRDRIEKGKAGDYETKTEQKTFQQRYFLNLSGPILDPRIAIFSIGTTFTHTWDDLNDANSRTKDYGYNIATTFFPQRYFPLTLYTNRFVSDTDSSIFASRKTTTTGYGLRWPLMLRSLPTIRLLMEQSETVSDDSQQRKDERKREASLELNKVTSSSVFFSRYRYENTLDKIGNSTSDAHGVDMNYGSQLTRILHLRTFGSYYTTGSRDGADTDIALKDNVDTGVGLYFHPAVYLDINTDYNFYYIFDESYASGERTRILTRRHLSSTSIYYHPDPRLDTRLGYYYGKTMSTTDIDNHQTIFNILGKPLTGLNLMGNASYLYSKSVSEAYYSNSKTQNYGTGFSYTLPFRNITFNTGYRFDYGVFSIEPGDDGHNISHSTGAGIAYNLSIALITADYQFLSRRESRADVEDREEHRYKLGLVSYYIRGLAATANLGYDSLRQRKDDEPWTKNELIIFGARLDYNIWRGLFFSGGYSLYNYSNPASNDSETLYTEGRIVFFPISNLFATVKIREEWIWYSLNPNKNTLLGEARLDYRIRKLLLSAEYSYSLETQGAMETTKNMAFLKVTRVF
jgi:hypothetical protein